MTRPVLPPDALSGARLIPALLAVCGVLAVAGALFGAATAVRGITTAVFLLLGPGWALAGFLVARSLAERSVVAAGSGAALSILVGQSMVVSGAWHPVGLLYVAAAVTVPVLMWHALRPTTVGAVTTP